MRHFSSSLIRSALLAATMASALLASGCAMRDRSASMGASGEPMGGTSATTDARQGGTPSTRGAMNPSSVANPEGGSGQ